MTSRDPRLLRFKEEIEHHLEADLIPFWTERAPDARYGGYLTNFGAQGEALGTPEKYLNTQMRLLWWFSALARRYPQRPRLLELAAQGFHFIHRHFWDDARGGWFWKVARDGALLDTGKITYGQSFAVYALAEYAAASGNARAIGLAETTFNLLHVHCADTRHGGYLENLEADWTPAAGGRLGGDRKGLDAHMHLMEAFTNLYAVGAKPHHRRKLLDLVALIAQRMIDSETGAGRNQFDLAFAPLPAVAVARTWNAERQGDAGATSADTTSFGHNAELAWLLRRALDVAKADFTSYKPMIRTLSDHTARFGVDWQHGGVFREGRLGGDVESSDKEFWQHAEVVVGFLDGYDLFGEPRYLDAAENVWGFVKRCFVVEGVGEWRTLLTPDGRVIDPNLGNPWKVAYHTGRCALECSRRLDALLSTAPPLVPTARV